MAVGLLHMCHLISRTTSEYQRTIRGGHETILERM